MDITETLDMILAKLKKLEDRDNKQPLSLENYVQNEICALLDTEASIGESFIKLWNQLPNEHFKKHIREQYKKDTHFSGSLVEGAMMARCFQTKENWKELEVDIMHDIFTISQEYNLEPVVDKPGFVHLNVSNLLIPGPVIHNSSGSSYISPLLTKNLTLKVSRPEPTDETLPRFMNVSASKTETTVEEQFDLSGLLRISVDLVPAIHLQFWPHQAASWITRCRLWPLQDTIKSIVEKGCQVVPRSSPGGDVNTEWRLSFSRPEAILAQLRTKDQQRDYYFFKMFFYCYLKCVASSEAEGKSLYSYIIKTTMMWACEELSPEDPVWASLENSVQTLLVKLLGSLQTGFLPHYFLPEINLLERIGQDVRLKCLAIISRWHSNILMTAPYDIPEKCRFIHFLSTGMLYTIAKNSKGYGTI